MQKVTKTRRIWLAVALTSILFGVAGIPGIIFFSRGGKYVAMSISIALVAHAFYGSPFYFLNFVAAGARRTLLGCVDHGVTTYADLAATAGMDEKTVRAHLQTAVAKQELVGYRLAETEILPVERKPDPRSQKPKLVRCPYCLTVGVPGTVCKSCGARIPLQAEEESDENQNQE